jgi:hypothetical protein
LRNVLARSFRIRNRFADKRPASANAVKYEQIAQRSEVGRFSLDYSTDAAE